MSSRDGPAFDHTGRHLGSLQLAAIYQRTIVARCPRCRHEARFEGPALWWLFHRKGWNDDLKHAARRLRCDRCFTASRRVVRPELRVNRDEATAVLPWPPESEWKRLVSRWRT